MKGIFRRLLAPPVFAEDEEKTRVAGLLNVILMIVLGLVVAFTIPAVIMTPSLGRILVELFILLVVVGMLVLMHRGYVRLSAFLLSSILWVSISFGTYQAGGFRGSTMSAYFGIILIAGLLLGNVAAVLFGGLSILFTGWLLYADAHHLVPSTVAYATPATFWSEFSTVVVGVVGLLALVMNSLQRALERARRNERELALKVFEVQQLAKAALEASEFKTRLIARVSHELRTPLGAIMGMAEMLHYDADGTLSSDQRATTQRIVANASYLEMIVTELIEQSQFEQGKIQVTEAPFALFGLQEWLEATFGKQAEQKGLAFEVHLDTSLPEVIYGDFGQLKQVLANLVRNALKFTQQGAVTVSLQAVDERHWNCVVSDTGIGIPAESQALIFEPFRQVDESTSRRYGGVGLGLTIVQQLTALMGGEVRVTSEVGRGSTFTVILPLKQVTEQLELSRVIG